MPNFIGIESQTQKRYSMPAPATRAYVSWVLAKAVECLLKNLVTTSALLI